MTNPRTAEDEAKFVDIKSSLHAMAGYHNLIFGSKIQTFGGDHGILPGDRRLSLEQGKHGKDTGNGRPGIEMVEKRWKMVM